MVADLGLVLSIYVHDLSLITMIAQFINCIRQMITMSMWANLFNLDFSGVIQVNPITPKVDFWSCHLVSNYDTIP